MRCLRLRNASATLNNTTRKEKGDKEMPHKADLIYRENQSRRGDSRISRSKPHKTKRGETFLQEGFPTIKLFFNYRFLSKDARILFRREFEAAVVGEKSVLFLLNVGELGVAEAEEMLVLEDGIG